MYNYLKIPLYQKNNYLKNKGLLAACLIAIMKITHSDARIQIGNNWVHELHADQLNQVIVLLYPLIKKYIFNHLNNKEFQLYIHDKSDTFKKQLIMEYIRISYTFTNKEIIAMNVINISLDKDRKV